MSSEVICPKDKIVFDANRGEYICTETGEVLEDKVVDQGPEWRAYTEEENRERSRAGTINLAVHDMGLSTYMDTRAKDRIKAMRLRKLQIRSRVGTSEQRNLVKAMTILERIIDNLGLPKAVKEEAAIIYRKALEKKLIKGRSIEEVVAASVYAACRKMNIPTTLDEISKATSANKKEIGKAYRLLLREDVTEVPASDPKYYVMKIASLLGLSGKVMTAATEIVERAKKAGITSGKDPASIAAAAVYIAANINGERRSQREISEVSGVTQVTIRNRYREIARELGIDIEGIN
ncbi:MULTISPECIES: transcription initiation factor IIB [Acidianus]|jgi:Transcription initiation factor TFIIIB, Brf1 subunit/Transcription initiation factor TFIIB|uniref:Transcription initiation factor IIB n=3 Tax=Acidianus TaxID=12914 RepID=A0A650CVW3_ACIAM|nr:MULTISPECIES: TFIIB-type zinc ribbon-containing protein [Acidianus]AEE92986.1 transcription initiation factor TFIIB [Acidianus hospitalis W1]MQL55578.1 transcription initiation factor IIB [Acidianus ambivalens]QGR21835.1 transcription initiation factor IIB [Acidianus ambivalens]